MALTFVVETGMGIPFANSYVTVEEADEYLEANIHAWTTWSVLDPTQKEALLIWATRYLDQRVEWNGYRTLAGSSLRWPRSGVRDLDQGVIDDYSIPLQLKWAVIELAFNLIASDPNAPSQTAGIEKLKVDVIELTFSANFSTAPIPTSVVALLFGLGIFRGVGGFAKIRRS